MTASAKLGTAEKALVDASWLAAHLHDPNVRVVEVDVSAAAHDDWHIDGAILWNIYSDLKDSEYRTVARTALEALLARAGIGPDTTVVFYGYAPALGVWLLSLLNHRDARILDCSRETWRADGRPWTTTATTAMDARAARAATAAAATRRQRHVKQTERQLRADRAGVEAALGRPGVTLVDVRSQPEYEGERFWPSGAMQPDGRAGHIPGAIHQPIDGLHRPDGSFLPAAELRQALSGIDIDGDDELIVYCTIGGRAATAWFVLTRLLGRDRVRVYDASWAEWGRTPTAPIAGR